VRVLLVDNYDSYTHNLRQQLARLGSLAPRVVRNDELSAGALTELIAAHDIEAIVISPGPGHPARPRDFGVCEALITGCELPLLGVCLGHQGLAWAYGAAVGRAPEPVHGRRSPVFHEGKGLFHGIPQGFEVVRYHSLAVARELPAALHPTAWTHDGVLMGLAHAQRPQWGVQFHPESIATAHGDRVIENFLALADDWHRRERGGRVQRSAQPRAAAAGAPPPRAPVRPPSPLHHRELERWVDPADVFVARYGEAKRAFWLDSASTEGDFARWSYMGAAELPGDRMIRYDVTRRELVIEHDGHVERQKKSVLEWLEVELGRRGATPSPGLPVPFTGGVVGYLGYELKAECDGAPGIRSPLADAMLLACQRFVAFDHRERRVWLCSREPDAHASERWFDETATRLTSLDPAPPPAPARASGSPPLRFVLQRGRTQYLADIDVCQERIKSGETYEVCLTNQLVGPPITRPLDAYRVLRARNPAPMAAYLRLDELAILSCSPELFLRIDAEGRVVTKPIKGTTARGATPAEDEAAKARLAASDKDCSENLMIVDLMRNDLGRVCEIGSVEVPALMRIESFASVHQLVSTVQGRLAAGLGPVDCLRATFPGGSMTGAPKLRTLEIIEELEGAPRGVYSGCIGHLGDLGTHSATQLSIAIRTAVCTPERTSVGVGGAVVALSDPTAEFEEILLKGDAVLRGLAVAETGDPTALIIDVGPPAPPPARSLPWPASHLSPDWSPR
jgi:para-aminobenzoate synthetase